MARLWLFDFDGTLVDSEPTIKKCYVKVILEFVSLWKSKNNVFGLYIKPHQIKVNYSLPPPLLLNEYSLIKLELT